MIGAAGERGAPTMDDHHAGETASLRPARLAVQAFLSDNGVADEVIERAKLIVSELATNAVEASPGRDYRLSVAVDADRVIIRVRNRAPGGPLPPRTEWGPDSLLALRGRGLHLVAALADEVGVHEQPESVEVTAVIATG
jgi:anti-sigma regulatory factor (Ser/Thr protein kinase)